MSLLINIDNLLNKQRIESNRVEFKTGWNPSSIYHSICAFANDIDDLGGGYVIVGIDTDENVVAKYEGCENRLSSGISSETGSETGSETPKRTIDKILRIIKERPGITNAELANILGISPRAVGKHLKKLRDDNRIVRVGSPTYGGGWESLEE